MDLVKRMRRNMITALALTFFLISILSTPLIEMAAASPASDLIGVWHFDEGEGTIAFDSTIHGNDGALVNMGPESWVEGIFGYALDFDGVDDYIDVSGGHFFDIYDFTAEAWIYPHGTVGTMIIWTKFDDKEGYALIIKGGKLGFCIGLEAYWVIFLVDSVSPDSWHHCAVTYDRIDVETVQIKMFMDGEFTGDTLLLNGGVDYVPLDLGPRIGADLSGADLFDGLIDEVHFWNRALTAEEVGARFTALTKALDLKGEISALSDENGVDLKKPAVNRKTALLNKVDEVIEMINEGNCAEAINKLEKDITPKLNGDKKQSWAPHELTDILERIETIVDLLKELLT
jgi:hypothetical protein